MLTDTTRFSEEFLQAANPHTAWIAEQLETFNEYAPSDDWHVNFDKRLFRMGDREITIGLLGTYDTEVHTWGWAWANPRSAGRPISAAAEGLREFGAKHGIVELTEEMIDFSAFGNPRMAVETLACASMGLLDATGYIGVTHSANGRSYMIPEDPRIPRATPDWIKIPRLLTLGVGMFEREPWRVVSGYFDHHGVGYRMAIPRDGKPGMLEAELPDGHRMYVEFDELGRIARMNGS